MRQLGHRALTPKIRRLLLHPILKRYPSRHVRLIPLCLVWKSGKSEKETGEQKDDKGEEFHVDAVVP
ncbi:hypothetical protein AX14_006695, partial [Amanita brunnescens Koide BX004]